jgi:hypothetical protein
MFIHRMYFGISEFCQIKHIMQRKFLLYKMFLRDNIFYLKQVSNGCWLQKKMELQQKFSLTVTQKLSVFMRYGLHKNDSFMNYFKKLKR